MVDTARKVVAIFGLLIVAASCWGMVSPSRLLRTVDGLMGSGIGMPIAVGVRVILGTALLVAARESSTPQVFFVVGGLILFTASALPFIGRRNVGRLVRWLRRWPTYAIRGWLVFGVAFGAYLVWAVAG